MNFSFRFFGSCLVLALAGCEKPPVSVSETDYVYRQDMRYLVKQISQKARTTQPGFFIVPQNGQDVALQSYCEDCSSQMDQSYLNSISAIGREDLYYGYSDDNIKNSVSETQEAGMLLDIYHNAGIPVLVTDYCASPSNMDDSYQLNSDNGFISFAAPSRNLDVIPAYPAQPYQVHNSNVTSLGQAKNFLYLLDASGFSSRTAYLQALAGTNYDLLVIDAFYQGSILTQGEVNSLKVKSNGGSRIVLAYMSIGEAEDYRYYWQSSWDTEKPEWLLEQNPDWEGNYKVQYWNSEWHNILYNSPDSYLQKLLTAEFDGAYLDLIDAFEYFEE